MSWFSKTLRGVEQLFCCSFFIFLFIAFLKWAILECIAQGSVFRAPTVSWDLWRRWRMTVARKSTPASVGGYWYCSNSSRPHFHAQRTRLSVGCGTNQLGPFISSLFFSSHCHTLFNYHMQLSRYFSYYPPTSYILSLSHTAVARYPG